MNLPSEARFLDVFESYNRALWPAVALLWIATLALVVGWLRGRSSNRSLGTLLALQWLWVGVVHLEYFTRISPNARFVGSLFLLQGAALAWVAVARARVSFVERTSPRGVLAVGLVLYALAYPLLGLVFGLHYPRMPTFGVPCATTLLTAGLLLAAEPRAPRLLFVVPLLWCLVAGFGALLYGILADLALFVAAAALLGHALVPLGRTPLRAA